MQYLLSTLRRLAESSQGFSQPLKILFNYKMAKIWELKANPIRLFKMVEANFVKNHLIKIVIGWRLGFFLYPRVM